jgi:hypothetical protein
MRAAKRGWKNNTGQRRIRALCFAPSRILPALKLNKLSQWACFSYPCSALDGAFTGVFSVSVTWPQTRSLQITVRSTRCILPDTRPMLLLMLWLGVSAAAQTASSPLPTLTHVDQVRRLSPEQARLGYPVRIRGVVTGDVPAPDFFVQDETAGVYVEGSHSPLFRHVLGERVEVEGITGPGWFAPVIREQSVHVLGKAALPKAHLYSFTELADGQQDSQWVQVRGIVQSVSIDRTSWHETTLAMNVASGSGQFKVRVPIGGEQDFSSWLDSEVLIEGVCGSLFNSDRQLVGVLFYVPRLSFIRIKAPAKEVPFPAFPGARPASTRQSSRRSHTPGTGKLSLPSESAERTAGAHDPGHSGCTG